MNIEIPPAPSHEAALGVMERLGHFARSAPETEEDAAKGHMSNVPFAISGILSVLGTVLLVCSLAVTCAPESALSQAVHAACALLP